MQICYTEAQTETTASIEIQERIISNLQAAQTKKKISRSEKNLNMIKGLHISQIKENPTYENLLLNHIAVFGRMGGFQSKVEKVEEIKIDYFNDTGEKLSDSNICILSENTFGNAMRLYFPLPEGMSLDELIAILPEMPKIYHRPDQPENSQPVLSDGEVVITNMRYIRTLLQIGFRHGTAHNIEQIKKSVEDNKTANG